jgi:hypothetical protein
LEGVSVGDVSQAGASEKPRKRKHRSKDAKNVESPSTSTITAIVSAPNFGCFELGIRRE